MSETSKAQPVAAQVGRVVIAATATLTIRQALDYEIRSSWWASWISWTWFQDIAGRWFAFKVNRKFARYCATIQSEKNLRQIRAR